MDRCQLPMGFFKRDTRKGTIFLRSPTNLDLNKVPFTSNFSISGYNAITDALTSEKRSEVSGGTGL